MTDEKDEECKKVEKKKSELNEKEKERISGESQVDVECSTYIRKRRMGWKKNG